MEFRHDKFRNLSKISWIVDWRLWGFREFYDFYGTSMIKFFFILNRQKGEQIILAKFEKVKKSMFRKKKLMTQNCDMINFEIRQKSLESMIDVYGLQRVFRFVCNDHD